jgi:hypothetical protein
VSSWSAVTRGAMLRGLQGDIVESRIIRAYYGIMISHPWNPALHESETHREIAERNKYVFPKETHLPSIYCIV